VEKLHNENLHDLHTSPHIIRVTKSKRIRWTGHVARMENWRGVYRVWWGNLRDTDHLKFPFVDGTIILKLIFRKWDGGMEWIDLA